MRSIWCNYLLQAKRTSLSVSTAVLTLSLHDQCRAEQSIISKDVCRAGNLSEWLLSQPSEEILNHTYEYTVREDILLSMEYNDLPDEQVKALLKSPSSLADVFKDWEHKETGYMEDIWQTVADRAKSEVQKQKKKKKNNTDDK